MRAIEVVLITAHKEGNYLKNSWREILDCISELEVLKSAAQNKRSSGIDVFKTAEQPQRRNQRQAEAKSAEQIKDFNARASEQVDNALVDKVFTTSASLNSDAIIEFVDALRKVSLHELESASSPRVFSLQKIIEITYYNMKRIRLVWSRIWAILSPYFTDVGCHSNLQVSLHAIDSLRQLSMKFLEKDELANFQFQSQFFQPFAYIMQNNSQPVAKELIVQCFLRMVQARAQNIKSGWKTVFSVLQHAARDSHESLVATTFEFVQSILTGHFPQLHFALPECCNCLVSFGRNTFTSSSLKSIDFIVLCVNQLIATVRKAQAEESKTSKDEEARAQDTEEKEGEEEEITLLDVDSSLSCANILASRDDQVEHAHVLKVLFISLLGLVQMAKDARPEVRTRALKALLQILRTNGSSLSATVWSLIFREVLFPMFGFGATKAPEPAEQKDKRPAALPTSSIPRTAPGPVQRMSPCLAARNQTWLKTTCAAALPETVGLFVQFYSRVNSLLPYLLQLLNSAIRQGIEVLCQTGVKSWARLIFSSGQHFSSDQWEMVVTQLKESLQTTLPQELESEESVWALMQKPAPPQAQSASVKVESKTNKPPPPPRRRQSTPTKRAPPTTAPPAVPQADPIDSVSISCNTQLSLIDAAFHTLFLYAPFSNSGLPGTPAVKHFGVKNSGQLLFSHIFMVLDTLIQCAEFSGKFNANVELRKKLKMAGFALPSHTPNVILPNLYYHQGHCLEVAMCILFGMYSAEDNEGVGPEIAELRHKCLALSRTTLEAYLNKAKAADRQTGEGLSSLDPAVIVIIQGLANFSPAQFSRHLSDFCPLLTALIAFGSLQIRQALAPLIERIIADFQKHPPEKSSE